MKVTIHQPEHFPYMGFFQKMSEADLFIVLDNVKFRKNYFQNRNKLLNKSGNEEWFTVPVEKKASSKIIRDVLTNTMAFASDFDVTGSKSQLLANLIHAVGGKHYISGPSGKDYLDMSCFKGIEVSFFQPKVKNYYSSLYNVVYDDKNE